MNKTVKFTLILTIFGMGAYWFFKDDGNALMGGKGDKLTEDDVDPDELKKGIDIEMEHTKSRKIAKEIALDHLAEDTRYYTRLAKIHKENPTPAKKKNKKLWEQVKKAAAKKMGGHSARAMQYATKMYQQQGGKYEGKKSKKNSLTTWTKADWQYAPGSKKKDRYLPKKAWDELSPSEEKATRAKKKGKMGKWVKNTKKASKAAKKATAKARKKK